MHGATIKINNIDKFITECDLEFYQAIQSKLFCIIHKTCWHYLSTLIIITHVPVYIYFLLHLNPDPNVTKYNVYRIINV